LKNLFDLKKKKERETLNVQNI